MKIQKLFHRRRHRLAAALLLAVAFAAGFASTSLLNQYRFAFAPAIGFHDLNLDAWIPFAPSWVWVYLLYYPFCFLPLLLREVRNDPAVFMRTGLALSLQFGFSFFCFVVLPLKMAHPKLPGGAASDLLAMLYSADRGFNSFPSLHVANVTFVVLLFERLRGARTAVPLAAVAILIALSAVLVKQHYISDVIVGACLGWMTFSLAFHEELRLVAQRLLDKIRPPR